MPFLSMPPLAATVSEKRCVSSTRIKLTSAADATAAEPTYRREFLIIARASRQIAAQPQQQPSARRGLATAEQQRDGVVRWAEGLLRIHRAHLPQRTRPLLRHPS